MQTSYVTEPILKTSFLPRSCLSLASGAYASGHVRSESSRPSSFVLADSRSVPRFSSSSRTVEHNRTIQRTFAERQKELNEARVRQVGNRDRKTKRQNSEIRRRTRSVRRKKRGKRTRMYGQGYACIGGHEDK